MEAMFKKIIFEATDCCKSGYTGSGSQYISLLAFFQSTNLQQPLQWSAPQNSNKNILVQATRGCDKYNTYNLTVDFFNSVPYFQSSGRLVNSKRCHRVLGSE
jgi:hypothetical protein